MTVTVASSIVVREKLESRLTSSLPLSSRCQLAVKVFTSPIFIPGKEELILAWILKTLDKKYTERLSKKGAEVGDTELWDILSRCLSHLSLTEATAPIEWNIVAETLTNVLPHSDLSNDSVRVCVTQLLALSCVSCLEGHGVMWACVLTALITHSHKHVASSDDLLMSTYKILDDLEIDTSQDYSDFLVCLSQLYSSHPYQSILDITRRLVFPSHDPYTQLFSHLACTEGKYQPGHAVSLLLSVLPRAVSAPLLLACCPRNPDWLRHKLTSLLFSAHGYPGNVNENSIIGSQILSAKKIGDLDIGSVLQSALPLSLEFESTDGQNMGKYLQGILRVKMSSVGLTEDVCLTIKIIHTNYPQLLEPLVGLILEKRLESPKAEFHEAFSAIVDVMGKLRQLPKLVSKLFLHLRTVKSKKVFTWSPDDLTCLQVAIGIFPKVQCLELWKALNYHLSSDLLNCGDPIIASNAAQALSPLMASVLTSLHIADHNTPSSLTQRITDLMDATLECLRVVKNRSSECGMMRLLVETTAGLHKLSAVTHCYRGLDHESINHFAFEVATLLNEVDTEIKSGSSAQYLHITAALHEKTKKDSTESNSYVELATVLSQSPETIENVPDHVLLGLAKSPALCVAVDTLFENHRICSAVLFSLLSKLNGQEAFFIPEFEHWKSPGNLDNLDSYLGKSLTQSLISMWHSECVGGHLTDGEWQLLESLSLENLPCVLKLAATMIGIPACLNSENVKEDVSILMARCLEATDIFRYLDAGVFIVKLVKASAPEFLVEVTCQSAARFTKSVIDVDRNFAEIEQLEQKCIPVCLHLLKTLEKTLTEEVGGDEKLIACKALASNLSKLVSRMFKKRDEENKDELDIFVRLASSIQNIYAEEGLGKHSKFVNKMLKIAFTEDCPSWMSLIHSTAANLQHLDITSLPDGWKFSSFQRIVSTYSSSCEPCLKSLFSCSSPEEIAQMMNILRGASDINPELVSSIIKLKVTSDTASVKPALEEVIGNICKGPQCFDSNFATLTSLLTTVFTSSPPCTSHLLEVSCLGLLSLYPPDLAHQPLDVLSSFMSHRPHLSVSVIPTIFSIIRRSISAPPLSFDTLQCLQKVLGLFSRHKADYAPVLSFLMADLLTLLQSLPVEQRGHLTTALFPLLDMLEKHSFTFLSANLDPSVNELFKVLLENYNARHKFKGKV